MQALTGYFTLSSADIIGLPKNLAYMGVGALIGGLTTYAVHDIAMRLIVYYCNDTEVRKNPRVAAAVGLVSTLAGYAATYLLAPQAAMTSFTIGKVIQIALLLTPLFLITMKLQNNYVGMCVMGLTGSIAVSIIGGLLGAAAPSVVGGLTAGLVTLAKTYSFIPRPPEDLADP